MRVQIICRNWREDRVIPRMARALAEGLGWGLGSEASKGAQALYLLAYFEAQRLRPWPGVPVAAYFTHREEEPAGSAKARLYDQVAKRVALRVATCRLYAEPLSRLGPTVQAAAPLERERFTPLPSPRRRGDKRPVVGLSGYTYSNRRKGEDLIRGMLGSKVAQRVEWRASGRGWPVPTRRYSWAEMPRFYQGLDVLVVPSRVEGIPMPPLEALACGVSIVIPQGVGLLDELPEVPGIWRYRRGDVKSLVKVLERAAFPEGPIDREALREATAPYSVEAWVRDHVAAFAGLVEGGVDAGIAEVPVAKARRTVKLAPAAPRERGTGSARGIYCVAFGDPARTCALRLMESAKRHMPDIPIALCAAKRIGPEDLLIEQADSDVGGRRAKLRAYELAPAEWQATLYLDADTEVVAPIYRFFEWIEDGWDFVITKDPHLFDTMHSFERKNNQRELEEVRGKLKTLHTLQWNGGVWAFARNDRVAAFFRRWQEEWEKHAQRDQGALVRAMYAAPLKIWLLGNEWNTFPKYMKRSLTAGLLHFPGDARRWRGMIPGRIDSPEAWRLVKEFEGRRRAR